MATPTRPERDPMRFDRSDRWALTALLATWVLVTVYTGIVEPISRWVDGDAVPVEVLGPVEVPALDAAGVGYGDGLFPVSVPVEGAGLRLAELLPGVIATGLVLAGVWVALRLMRTIAAGDPFAPANVTRLRVLAGLLVIGTAVLFFADLSVRGALVGTLGEAAPEGAQLSVPWQAILAGMVVALLAEAFKAGSRLRDDVEGLV